MRRAGLIGAVTLAGVLGAAVAVVAARDALYWGKPLPGVTTSPVDIARPVVVRAGGQDVRLRPAEVVRIDQAATEAARVAAGRGSVLTRVRALVDPSPPPIRVEPVLVLREDSSAIADLERRLRRPQPARIDLRGGSFAAVPARAGERVDVELLGSLLTGAARGGPRRFDLPLASVRPEPDTAAAEEAAATARGLAADSVELTFRGKHVGTLSPRRLARLVRFARRGDRFLVTLDEERLARAVRPSLDRWRVRARNARFFVDGVRVRMTPSRPGLDVNPAAALASVTAAAYSSRRTAELALRQTRADLTTREARKLGIRRRISSFTTEMGTSSSNRIHNVHLMADYIDGTIVRPGERFSFNESVGPRTVERGFREGQMILGSLLLPAIGGGVCQTATTLFNNAFELGLPIVERHNHSFYISHYPLGRDATVSWGGPDLVFRNDLRSAILIKTTYTDSTLTFSFYGSDPHRRVVAETGPKINWRSPTVSYALDPYAPRGSVRTVAGSNQSGFDVTVTRKVYERGKLKRKDAFTSPYVAVGPTQIYGPGRTIPGPYFVLPRV